MGTIRSGLLEKAGFGQFQQENQDALATFQQAKQDIRTKRKLGEAQDRAEQVRVKFNFKQGAFPEARRHASITLGNKVNPVNAYYTYNKPDELGPQRIHVFGVTPPEAKGSPFLSLEALSDKVKNTIFRPSQLKQVIDAVKKRYPKAETIEGTRITGSRVGSAGSLKGLAGEQIIPLAKKAGKKLGLLGLGLSLGEAIRAGKAAYDANEGKL